MLNHYLLLLGDKLEGEKNAVLVRSTCAVRIPLMHLCTLPLQDNLILPDVSVLLIYSTHVLFVTLWVFN